MVGAELEAGVAHLLQQVAQLLRHLHVVGQDERARRGAGAEGRARHDRGRAQAHDQRVAGGRGPRHRADHAGGARDVRGGVRTPAQPRHQVEAQLEAGAEHLLAGRDQVAAGASLVDGHEHLVGARLEAEVHARQPGVGEQREVLRRAPRQRARAPVRGHALDRREALADPADDRRELLRLDRARVRVLQKDRARRRRRGRATPGTPRAARAPRARRATPRRRSTSAAAAIASTSASTSSTGRSDDFVALVHGAERAAVPGAVADHAHQQAVRLAGRADGALLERRGGHHALSRCAAGAGARPPGP